MSVMWNAWKAAKQANEFLRKAPQFLDLIADNARVLVKTSSQRGADQKYLKALVKQGKAEEEIAKDFAKLLGRFKQWLKSVNREAPKGAQLRQEFEDFLQSFRARQKLKGVVDPRGHVSAAVLLKRQSQAAGTALGRDLEALTEAMRDYRSVLKKLGLTGGALEAAANQAESILSGFLRVWETRRPVKKIEEIMKSFAKEREAMRKEIIKLRAAAAAAPTTKAAEKFQRKADKLREEIMEAGRDRFATARKQIMQDVFDDPGLRSRMESVGLLVDKEGTGTVSFVLELGTPELVEEVKGVAKIASADVAKSRLKNVQVKLNIDHAKTDFVDAIDTWIDKGVTDALAPVLAGSNMRIVTGLENQVMFNYLKKDLRELGKPLSKPMAVGNALATPAWENTVEGVVKKIETLLGKSLGARERVAVRDYVDMAMQMSK